MGVEGLWNVVSAAAEHVSLRSLCISEAVERKKNRLRRPILGVDISSIMGECTAATQAAGIHGQFYGGALRIFFTKLGMYLRLPVTLVFVFDGPGRPDFKRGTNVVHRVPYWTDILKQAVFYFGYYSHQAPGEAEAELAELNQHGYIDGIITSDSDVLVFGALRVFKTIPKKDRKYDYEVILHVQETIARDQEIMLTQGGLLLYALLAGGDYEPGIHGCGAAAALGLAQCGFGDQLLQAINTSSGQNLDRLLHILRQDIRNELATNSQGKLGSRHITLSRSSDFDDFPNLQVADYYRKPTTTFSTGQGIPDLAEWKFREPSVSDIVTFCYTHLGTRTEEALKGLMRSHIWEGVFAQVLYSPYLLYDASRKLLATPNTQAPVITAVRKMRHLQKRPEGSINSLQPRITISVTNFVRLMGRNLGTDNLEPLVVWAADEFLPDGVIQKTSKRKRPQKERAVKTESGGPKCKHPRKLSTSGSSINTEIPIYKPGNSCGTDKLAQRETILDVVDRLQPLAGSDSGGTNFNPQSTASTSQDVIELSGSESEEVLTSMAHEVIELTDSDSEKSVIDLTHLV